MCWAGSASSSWALPSGRTRSWTSRRGACYRRVFLAGNPEVVREFCQSLTRPRVSRLLFQVDDPRTLPRQRDFVVDFCAGALTSYFIELCASRKPLDWAEVRCCLGGLLEVLRPAEDLCLQVQAG